MKELPAREGERERGREKNGRSPVQDLAARLLRPKAASFGHDANAQIIIIIEDQPPTELLHLHTGLQAQSSASAKCRRWQAKTLCLLGREKVDPRVARPAAQCPCCCRSRRRRRRSSPRTSHQFAGQSPVAIFVVAALESRHRQRQRRRRRAH